MRKEEEQRGGKVDKENELLKAVAQAWHSQASNPRLQQTKEFDAHKSSFHYRPSRFKLEAMSLAAKEASAAHWDFAQSLWDSYEIVTLSKKLEANLGLEEQSIYGGRKIGKRARESRNSLRSLLTRGASKRLGVDAVPTGDKQYPFHL